MLGPATRGNGVGKSREVANKLIDVALALEASRRVQIGPDPVKEMEN